MDDHHELITTRDVDAPIESIAPRGSPRYAENGRHDTSSSSISSRPTNASRGARVGVARRTGALARACAASMRTGRKRTATARVRNARGRCERGELPGVIDAWKLGRESSASPLQASWKYW